MDELIQLIRAHSLKLGEFTLASGRPSNYLIDLKSTTLHPQGAVLIALAVLDAATALGGGFAAVGGMATGCIPMVAVIAAESASGDDPLPAFYVRKASKGHGSDNVIDGCFRAGQRVLLVEDVTTTGGSVLEAAKAVRALGGIADTVITVVDRQEGAAENLAQHGLLLHSLLCKTDILDG